MRPTGGGRARSGRRSPRSSARAAWGAVRAPEPRRPGSRPRRLVAHRHADPGDGLEHEPRDGVAADAEGEAGEERHALGLLAGGAERPRPESEEPGEAAER